MQRGRGRLPEGGRFPGGIPSGVNVGGSQSSSVEYSSMTKSSSETRFGGRSSASVDWLPTSKKMKVTKSCRFGNELRYLKILLLYLGWKC